MPLELQRLVFGYFAPNVGYVLVSTFFFDELGYKVYGELYGECVKLTCQNPRNISPVVRVLGSIGYERFNLVHAKFLQSVDFRALDDGLKIKLCNCSNVNKLNIVKGFDETDKKVCSWVAECIRKSSRLDTLQFKQHSQRDSFLCHLEMVNIDKLEIKKIQLGLGLNVKNFEETMTTFLSHNTKLNELVLNLGVEWKNIIIHEHGNLKHVRINIPSCGLSGSLSGIEAQFIQFGRNFPCLETIYIEWDLDAYKLVMLAKELPSSIQLFPKLNQCSTYFKNFDYQTCEDIKLCFPQCAWFGFYDLAVYLDNILY